MQALGGIELGSIVGDVAGKIAGMGLSCIKASAQMRQYEIAFQTMLKSADAGTKILKDLQKFAADTPFDVPGVVESAQQLVAFGFAANEVIPTLRTLGDAAAGLGKSTEGVQQLAYALGQIKTSGTLKTEDINQLTNAGIGAWEMLAQASGKSISEIKDMTAKGMIDSLTAVEVLTNGINKAYGGMMEKTSKEITGLVSNIEETVGNTSVVIGKYMIDAFDIKGILSSVSDSLGNVSTKLTEAQEAGKSFSEAVRECVPAPVAIPTATAPVDLSGGAGKVGSGTSVASPSTTPDNTADVVKAEEEKNQKVLDMQEQLNVAKEAMNTAFREADREQFLEYLNSEQMDKLLALEQEQELRQQLLDWRMESEQTMLDFQMQAGEAVKNQLASGIADLITNGGKLSDVFKNIGKSIVNMFVQFMVKKQAAAALEKMLGKKQAADSAANSAKEATAAVPAAVQKSISVLGPIAGPPAYTGAVATMTSIGLGSISASSIMGGVQEKASGGPVFGAGTGTSDSIPAMLSNGEYVINAKAVRRIGLPLLNALNNGYASGGFIGGGDSSSSTVVEFNNYGDINNGTDYDSLMGDFEYTLAMGMRGQQWQYKEQNIRPKLKIR